MTVSQLVHLSEDIYYGVYINRYLISSLTTVGYSKQRSNKNKLPLPLTYTSRIHILMSQMLLRYFNTVLILWICRRKNPIFFFNGSFGNIFFQTRLDMWLSWSLECLLLETLDTILFCMHCMSSFCKRFCSNYVTTCVYPDIFILKII